MIATGERASSFNLTLLTNIFMHSGGTAVAAVNLIQDWGCPLENIRFISLIASMSGIATVVRRFSCCTKLTDSLHVHMRTLDRSKPALDSTYGSLPLIKT